RERFRRVLAFDGRFRVLAAPLRPFLEPPCRNVAPAQLLRPEPDLFPEPLAQKLGHAPAQAVPDHLQHVSGTLVEARPLEVRTTRTVYEPYGHVEQVAHLLHGPGDDRAHAE